MSSLKRWIVVAGFASGTAACGGGGNPDTGPADAGGVDVARDGYSGETGPIDTGVMDTGVMDSGTTDTGATDTGTTDAGGPDVVGPDVPATDVALTDATFADGGACGPVIDLTASGTVTGMTTRFVGDTSAAPMAALVPTSCGAPAYEVVLSYVAHATSTLVVSVVNPGTALTFDTVLAVRSDCAAGAELGCDDDTLPDRRSSLTSTLVGAGQTVYIVVAGSTTSGPHYVDRGPFELTVTEHPIGGPCDPTAMPSSCGPGFECTGTGATATCRGYTETSLAAPTWIDACATGTHATLTGTDDGHSQALTLPFAFTYFGTAYTSATADTNGYVVLGTATPSNSYGASLPIGDGPLVAPFHDDLVVNDAPTGAICTLAVGAGATQQYVIEWTGTTRYDHASVDLAFEVVLNDTTNTVDFIYHTLTGTGADAPFATGAMAAIGLEGDDGNTVVQHAGAVTAGTGLRYTPFP